MRVFYSHQVGVFDRDGLQNGWGCRRAKGARFIGQFALGKRHGFGRLAYQFVQQAVFNFGATAENNSRAIYTTADAG